MIPPRQATESRAVSVRFFAAARERAGSDVATVQVPVGASVGDLREALGESLPALRPLSKHLLFAVGTEYAADDTPIPENAEVVAFPPVSGG